jgi:hypothetical protein
MQEIVLKKGSIFAVIFWITVATHAAEAKSEFTGSLELLPPGCESKGECKLGKDFGFIDAAGLGWQAAKDLVTDGASIPPWAKPFIGQSFEPAFIKAAVIHDHYCDRHVRPWRQTHKVFHEALLRSGVSDLQAGIMYFAVMVGGPKWVTLIKGRPCPVGMGCINQVDISAAVSGALIASNERSEPVLKRSALYGTARFDRTMSENVPELLKLGNTLTAEQVEALAEQAMRTDFFFKNGPEVGSDLTIKLEVK